MPKAQFVIESTAQKDVKCNMTDWIELDNNCEGDKLLTLEISSGVLGTLFVEEETYDVNTTTDDEESDWVAVYGPDYVYYPRDEWETVSPQWELSAQHRISPGRETIHVKISSNRLRVNFRAHCGSKCTLRLRGLHL